MLLPSATHSVYQEGEQSTLCLLVLLLMKARKPGGGGRRAAKGLSSFIPSHPARRESGGPFASLHASLLPRGGAGKAAQRPSLSFLATQLEMKMEGPVPPCVPLCKSKEMQGGGGAKGSSAFLPSHPPSFLAMASRQVEVKKLSILLSSCLARKENEAPFASSWASLPLLESMGRKRHPKDSSLSFLAAKVWGEAHVFCIRGSGQRAPSLPAAKRKSLGMGGEWRAGPLYHIHIYKSIY